jgi:hypothetical protein
MISGPGAGQASWEAQTILINPLNWPRHHSSSVLLRNHMLFLTTALPLLVQSIPCET